MKIEKNYKNNANTTKRRRMSLFKKGKVKLNSGKMSDFKIDCDGLTKKDWDCLAYMISKRFDFRLAVGVPTGGTKLATALNKYAKPHIKYPVLVCDDVLTTGKSMEKKKYDLLNSNTIGVVIFARGKCPEWVTPIFQMTEEV